MKKEVNQSLEPTAPSGVAHLKRSANAMTQSKPIFGNQRLVARVAIGLFAIFFGFMAWQGIHYGEFWGKHGLDIRRHEQPDQYWAIFCFLSGASAGAAFICITWKKRVIAQTFPEE